MKTDEAEAIKTQHKKPKERHKTKKKKNQWRRFSLKFYPSRYLVLLYLSESLTKPHTNDRIFFFPSQLLVVMVIFEVQSLYA